jgi:hypothetical protein
MRPAGGVPRNEIGSPDPYCSNPALPITWVPLAEGHCKDLSPRPENPVTLSCSRWGRASARRSQTDPVPGVNIQINPEFGEFFIFGTQA